MNPDQSNIEIPQTQVKNPAFRVTKLSKYLAMVMFIIMPFIGGWIGYRYAPERVVYVDLVVPVEVENSEKKNQPTVSPTKLSDILYKGMKIGGMTLAEYGPYNPDYSEINSNNVKMLLKGPLEVTGTFEYVVHEIGFEGYCMNDFSEESIARLPYVPASDGSSEPRTWFCFRNEDEVFKKLGKDQKVVTVLIDNYELKAFPSEVIDRADLISVLE